MANDDQWMMNVEQWMMNSKEWVFLIENFKIYSNQSLQK
jgi:hypothetical protein